MKFLFSNKMLLSFFNKYLAILLLALSCLLTACSEMKISSNLSHSIFIEHQRPIVDNKLMIHFSNTTGYAMPLVKEDIEEQLSQKGYQIVSDPKKSNLILDIAIKNLYEYDYPPFFIRFLQGGKTILVGLASYVLSLNSENKESFIIAGSIAGATLDLNKAMKCCKDKVKLQIEIKILEKGSKQILTQYSGNHSQAANLKAMYNYNASTAWREYFTNLIIVAEHNQLNYIKAESLLKERMVNIIAGLL